MDPSVLDDVAARAELREGAEGVRRLLAEVVRSETGTGVRPVARRAGLPIAVAVAVVGELEKADLVDRSGDGLALTAAGESLVEDLGLTRRRVAPYLDEVPDAFGDVVDAVEQAARERGEADTTRDQAFATAETSVRRALTLLAVDALEGRRVLFVGDGDLVSVACHELGGADELVVVDVDPRIGDALPDEVGFVEADLRDGLPDRLHDRFDVATTDPPFTVAGTTLFLSRAVEALADGVGRTVLLSQPTRDPDGAAEIQAALGRLGLATRAWIPGFNRYEGAHMLGGRGDLLHLETTSRTEPVDVDGPIYTGEASPTRRRYRCVDCAATVDVGEDAEWTRVEDLKAEGCPECGATGFALEGRVEP